MIDFLGVSNSSSAAASKNKEEEQLNRSTFAVDSVYDEVETSLSLGILLHGEKKKRWDFSCSDEKTHLPSATRPNFLHPRINADPPYQPNNPWVVDLNSGHENAVVDDLQKKDNNDDFEADSNSPNFDRTRSSQGHIPTVAMARSATLARFLKKRSHRMNKASSSYIVSKTEHGKGNCVDS